MGPRKHSFIGTGLALAMAALSGLARAQTAAPFQPGQSPPAVVPGSPSPKLTPPRAAETQFYYDDGGKPAGPVNLAGLQAKVAAGAIGPPTLVWKSGTSGWVAARNLAVLASSFQSAPAVATPNPMRPPEIVRAAAATGPVYAIPLVQQWVKFTDPQERAFSLDMPKNWRNIGGANRFNGLQFRNWALAVSPDGETSIALNDPREPSYIAPSRLLAAGGFRIGSRYNGGGNTVYIVAPYLTGQAFAVSRGRSKLAATCGDVQVISSRQRADVSQTMNMFSRPFGIVHDAGEAEFSCKRGSLEMTGYVFAGTTALTGGIWYAEVITAFVAPSKVAGIAAGILTHMIRSVQVNPNWLSQVTNNAVALSRSMAQTNEAVSNSIMKGWESRGATIDRIMEEGSRERLGIDIYSDPVTGEKYTVSNNYSHFWVNSAGAVVGSETDTAPNGFRRLERVPP